MLLDLGFATRVIARETYLSLQRRVAIARRRGHHQQEALVLEGARLVLLHVADLETGGEGGG